MYCTAYYSLTYAGLHRPHTSTRVQYTHDITLAAMHPEVGAALPVMADACRDAVRPYCKSPHIDARHTAAVAGAWGQHTNVQ